MLGGVSAGMAYPTTLALITALWTGPERSKAIALWSALGGAIASLGRVVSAEATAQQFPQYATQITEAAKRSFLDGADWAYTAGIVAVLLGAALVFFLFPGKEGEERLLARYQAEDEDRPEPEPAGRPRAVA